ncbi:centromere/kinetochore protein zw10 homolog [Argentina anserina]|uniref:centromere/kinetochore protein zw10 homolog n=1 Tax=Argentina anserina TaxID=57926 RepID=UPI002176796B|nr:centromere/kinetochore protein zw10 homolog [Potentilla anserina]
MDALLDSINVRELLSAQDLSDPTTPLSAPDLRLLIQRLDSHSLKIKSKVQSYLLSHHHDFADLFSLCNDAVSRSHRLSDDLAGFLRSLSDRPVEAEIGEIVKQMSAATKEAREKRELLELVRAILEISENLKAAREAVRNGRLRFAAEELRELKKAVGVSDDDRVDEPVVYGLLRKEWSDCFDEIQEALMRFMDNAVRYEHETNRIRVKYVLSIDGNDGIELKTVLEALDVVGILNYGLSKVGDLMIKHVISPALNFGVPVSFVIEINSNSETMTEAVLKIEPLNDPKIEKMDGETIYSRITEVIKFINKYICFQEGSWTRCVGRLTWPRISDLIISKFLAKVVPQDASKLADFLKIINCTSEFETALKEMKFISVTENKDNQLSSFAENVEVHFASKKKAEILGRARNLLLRCDFAITQEKTRWRGKHDGAASNIPETVDLLFLSQRCVVSEAAINLMKLVHETLKDVCLSSPKVALEFYRAARDALLLYEVVIPVKLERKLDGINQVAVLMHNDCLYLSQEVLGFAFEYRSDFPTSLKEHAVFVDMALRFHLMAEDILHRQIQLVLRSLSEALDGADGFQNTHQMQQFQSAKFSIDQVVFILEKVHIIWEPLLLPSTYKRSMCTLLESVFSRITKDILLLDDMAAEETLELQRLIHLMLENLTSLLDSLAALQVEKSQERMTYLDDLVPSLRKIRKLAELLDMPLKAITSAWETEELRNSGFTSSEVEDFIKAIFQDSPLRKDCLWRIHDNF